MASHHGQSCLLVILPHRGIIAAVSISLRGKDDAQVMTNRVLLILLAGVILFASVIFLAAAVFLATGLGCALPQRLAQRVAAEPTATLGPTKTPRPTFTSTPDWTPTPTITATPTNTPIPTDTPTPVATDTPTPLPATPTLTPAPPTATFTPAPPAPTPTPAPPTNTPEPTYPFHVVEQSNREYTHTNYHAIVIYVEILDANGTPLGGYRVVGDSTTGQHVVSAESCWDWCKATPPGGYAKVANVTLEPGPFIDGAWSIYLVDGGDTQVSPVVTLPYSSDPSQWVWDFVLLKQ